MGHAHDDRLHTQFGGHINNFLQCWDHNLTTLQTETFLRWVFLGQECLKASGTCQTGQNQTLLFGREVQHAGCLETLTDPVALLQRVDEHELYANFVTVNILQTVQDFPEKHKIVKYRLWCKVLPHGILLTSMATKPHRLQWMWCWAAWTDAPYHVRLQIWYVFVLYIE